jgi:hypothetical protein
MILRKIPVQEGEQYYDYGVYCGKYEFVSKCDICGEEFQHTYRHAKYCSQRCADVANIQSRKAYRHETCLKTCEHCGEQFQATRIDSLFCSAACRQANHRDKQKREKPAEQTTLHVVEHSWNLEKFVEQLEDNKIKCVAGFHTFSDSQKRKFSQANIRYIYINELDVPYEFYNALYKKEITQAQYEAKYKKHLQTLKLRLEIDKTDRVALLTEETTYNQHKEKCYNVILPEFIKKSLGLKKIINI